MIPVRDIDHLVSRVAGLPAMPRFRRDVSVCRIEQRLSRGPAGARSPISGM